MAEFEEKLNEILSSPQAMEQIMSLANSIAGGGAGEGASSPAPASAPSPGPAPAGQEGPGGLGSLLGQLDPAMLSKVMSLLSVYQDREDEKTRLLEAIRPFLRAERQSKLDQAMRITRLSRVIRSALTMFGGDANV